MKKIPCLLLIFCAPVFASSQSVIDSFPTSNKIQNVTDPHFYVQGHYNYNKLDIGEEIAGISDINSHGIGAVIGYQVNPWIAYQGHLQLFRKTNTKINNIKINAKQNPTLGMQLKLSTDTTQTFFGFLKAGLDMSSIDTDIGNSGTEKFATGSVGIGYRVTPQLFLEAEYTYSTGIDKDIYKDNGLISIGYRFD